MFAQDCSGLLGLLRIAQHCSGLLKIAQDCLGLLRIAQDCLELLMIAQDCSGLLSIAQHCSGLFPIAQKKIVFLCFTTIFSEGTEGSAPLLHAKRQDAQNTAQALHFKSNAITRSFRSHAKPGLTRPWVEKWVKNGS